MKGFSEMRRREDKGSTPVIGIFVVVVAAMYMISCGGQEVSESSTDGESDASTVVEASGPRGVRVNTPQVSPGYVYFAPLLSDTTYLIECVHLSVYLPPPNICYFTPSAAEHWLLYWLRTH